MGSTARKVLANFIFSSFQEDFSFNILAKGKTELEPLEGEGEDFSYKVTQEKFEIVQPESKSRIVSMASTASKKLYQLLTKTPYVLSLVSFSDVPGLLTKAGIRYKVYGETSAPFEDFNSELARMLSGLKKDVAATKVRVQSRGSGSKAAYRKVFVETNSFSVDVVLGPGWYYFDNITQTEEVPFAS